MESRSTPRSADAIGPSGPLCLIALVAVGGCIGTHTAPRSSSEERGARVSQAVELLWSIEGRASACTITRPSLLGDARRRELARFRARSRAGSLGYVLTREGDSPLPRVSSYVSCLTGGREDARQVTRVRFSRTIEAGDRAGILDALPFEARWGDEPCEGRCWPPRTVEIVAPDTIEIAMPLELLTPRGESDVRVLVTRELAERPNILELTAIDIVGTGVTAVELLETAPRGLVLARGLRGELDRQLAWDAFLAALGDAGLDPGGSGVRFRGGIAEQFWPLPWAMVQARIADEELATARTLRLALRDRIVPMAQIDRDAPEALRRQAGARARAATVSRDEDARLTWSRERAELLERLFELTEDVVALSTAIGLLGEIGDVRSAHALARRAFELLPDEPNVREAFVSSAPDLDALRAALATTRPDLDEASLDRVARTAWSARAQGIGFVTVEGSHRTLRSVAPRPLASTPPEELPIDGLAEVLYLLLRAQGQSASATFTLRAEGGLRPDGPSGHDLLAVRWGEGDALAWATVPVASPTLQRLRWTSALLRAQLPERGEVTLSAWLRDDAGLERSLSLRLALEPARARLVAASLRLPAATWTALGRAVLRPVSTLEGTRFPMPVLRLALPPETITVLRARLESRREVRLWGVRCEDDSTALTCRGEDGPDGLLELLVEIAKETLPHDAPASRRGE